MLTRVLFSFLFSAVVFCTVTVGWSQESKITQRSDSCVILHVDEASLEGNQRVWEFELSYPGNYVVQLVMPIEHANDDQIAKAQIDGASLDSSLEKSYIIEDGLVSAFVNTATLGKAGPLTLSLDTELPISQVRLVPEGYVRSRIMISSEKYYQPWLEMHKSPEKLAAMEWYKDARFGMFIHWGAYSEAAGSWKGTKIEDSPIKAPRVAEWLMFAFNISREEYREYAKQFNPDRSFAKNFAGLAKETGMRYMVITSKHHDGFALFDSAYSDFDIADASPYQGDLIKELYDACRAEGIEFGVYYSHGNDWGHGGDGNYANVKKYNDQFDVFTRPNGKNLWDPSPNSHAGYLENKAYPQVAELVKMLPDLRLIWFDGDGLITEAQAFRFYKMVYDLNPNIVINRRVGYNFGDYVDAGDNKTPPANELAAKHFETCGTANHSWGFKAHDHNWKSSNELLRKFVDIVSKGGNYLLNIGPDEKGNVPTPCVEGFREMGVWVKTNSDAIFGTSRWTQFNEGVKPVKRGAPQPESNNKEFWFSAKGNVVYAMSLAAPGGTARIQSLSKAAGTITGVRLLGGDRALKWNQTDRELAVDFQGIEIGSNGYALEVTLEPSKPLDQAIKTNRAEDAWYELVGRFSERPEFAYVEDHLDLPKVLIYGDSISIHYTLEVMEELKGKVDVYRLFRNGGSSKGFVQLMENMHSVMRSGELDNPWTFEWDVIHFNVGLHDLKYLTGNKLDKENGKQVTSPEEYKKNLRDIVAYLKRLAPSAKLVFATTTPVPEGAAGRFAGDAEKFNQAALEVLSDFPDIAINYLFAFTKPHHAEWWSKPGDVHFNAEGQMAQGNEVSRVISSSLSKIK